MLVRAPGASLRSDVVGRLPWIIFPFLFLPNLGLLTPTRFGALEISDFVVFPYLVACALALVSWRQRLPGGARTPAVARLRSIGAFFLAWAFLSTVTTSLRYGYEGSYETAFGLLKLSKFTLYVLSGLATVVLVRRTRDLNRLLWGLTIGGAIVAVALPFTVKGIQRVAYDPLRGFKAANALSVEMAVLIMFLGVAWAIGWGGRRWRRAAPFCIAGMIVGLAFSHGRGGWLAAIVGLAWLIYRRGKRRRAAVIAVAICIAAVIAYKNVPAFRYEVYRTFNTKVDYPSTYQFGSVAIDPGGRPRFWVKEGSKVIEAPVLGRGFFNRFPGSGLDWVGSHNFWIQMFLETGLPGGAAVLVCFWLLWRESRRCGVLPVEVALIVVLVGGMGGEYFYGGMPLMVALVVVGPVLAPIGRWVAAPPRRAHFLWDDWYWQGQLGYAKGAWPPWISTSSFRE